MNTYKIIITLVFFTTLTLTVRAQPTITSSVNSISGDSSSFIMDTLGVSNFGNAGSNITWNFTGLNSHYQFKRYYRVPDASTYNTSFPNATLVAYDSLKSFFTYWNNNTDSNLYYGFINPGISIQNFNINPIKYYSFPMTFNQSYTDSCVAITYPGPDTTNGIYSFHADAWGRVVLPNDTIQGCLRVVSTIYIGDSTTGSFSLTKEYSWFHPSIKNPVLTLVNVQVDSTIVYNYAIYKATNLQATSISEVNVNHKEISLFPNPVSSQLHFTSEVELIEVKIVNALGHQAYHNTFKSAATTGEINIANLPSGLYTALFKSKKGIHSTKFLVTR